MASTDTPNSNRTLARAASLLDAVDGGAVPAVELARRSGLSVSTAHRLALSRVNMDSCAGPKLGSSGWVTGFSGRRWSRPQPHACMHLMPFAALTNRIGGALVLFVTSLLVPFLG